MFLFHCLTARRACIGARAPSRFFPPSVAAACSAAIFGLAAVLSASGAYAQSYGDVQRAIPAQRLALPDAGNPLAKAGPTIYVSDSTGSLWTITLGTNAIRRVGFEGVVLTDIAFDPLDGQLYGESFSAFYRLNRTTGRATLLGSLPINDANALVFDRSGIAYIAGVNVAELYTLDLRTRRFTAVGPTGQYRSAGDLAFYNGGLVLSGYSAPRLTNTTPNEIVLLNKSTGAVLAVAPLNLANLFALASPAKNQLFGFAGTSLYQIVPGDPNIRKRTVFLKDFRGSGIGQIYGAAYFGNF